MKKSVIFALAATLLLSCNQNKDMDTITLTQEWDKTFALSEKVSHRKVTFDTQYGFTLAAACGSNQSFTTMNNMKISSKEALTFPLGEPNDAYAQYFSGKSFLAPLDGGYHNVTFEPGCRNNWHIHHGAVQVLTCVSGKGWYQEWGKPAVELAPGVIIEVPEGVKHWHGAQKDSWMQHLYLHKDTQENASNEWCEPVSDEHYEKL